MPSPNLSSTPPSLKTNGGNSKFWLQADNVAVGYDVLIVKRDGSAGYWDGNIDKIHAGKGARASVSYHAGFPANCPDTGKKSPPWGPGDIIAVTITVTNDSNPAESDSLDDDVIADAD